MSEPATPDPGNSLSVTSRVANMQDQWQSIIFEDPRSKHPMLHLVTQVMHCIYRAVNPTATHSNEMAVLAKPFLPGFGIGISLYPMRSTLPQGILISSLIDEDHGKSTVRFALSVHFGRHHAASAKLSRAPTVIVQPLLLSPLYGVPGSFIKQGNFVLCLCWANVPYVRAFSAQESSVVNMIEETVVSAPTLAAGPFSSATPKYALSAPRRRAFPAHVVGTGLVVVASRSLRPFVGFLRALCAFSISAHCARTSGLASYADVWGSVMTAQKNQILCKLCEKEVCDYSGITVRTECRVLTQQCKRCAHFHRNAVLNLDVRNVSCRHAAVKYQSFTIGEMDVNCYIYCPKVTQLSSSQ
ncbi:hypothetical protein BDR07DRAFT_1458196 [Suillus spraguei]|nr:hypothetical protein BDR07DRAFT_1458196 [Suillus spraguei]